MLDYTTPADLSAYLGIPVEELPFDAPRLISRASEFIFDITLGRCEWNLLMRLSEANRNRATCMQIEYWMHIDESMDIMGAPESMKLGDFSTTQKFDVISPRARRVLWASGVLTRDVRLGTMGNNIVYDFFHNNTRGY